MFTTKTEYGLRAMAALAKNGLKKPMSLTQIAKAEHISQSYLERLFAKLKADDLVSSVKGAEGGYVLAHQPEKITIFELVESLEGPLAIFYCFTKEDNKFSCSSKKCLTKNIWLALQQNMIHTLRKFTLADLI